LKLLQRSVQVKVSIIFLCLLVDVVFNKLLISIFVGGLLLEHLHLLVAYLLSVSVVTLFVCHEAPLESSEGRAAERRTQNSHYFVSSEYLEQVIRDSSKREIEGHELLLFRHRNILPELNGRESSKSQEPIPNVKKEQNDD